ncbi:hypothetical protein FQN60_014639 [Etheostoma spectabile]|uniref:Uncharacterized protein n=1 Tax=Etheostoma spectabile TaxID=54343 RepID=A0A5J5DCP4_9PERO|nr:hypothetical protein FQN60_014639 [Etheostoma spectabile]
MHQRLAFSEEEEQIVVSRFHSAISDITGSLPQPEGESERERERGGETGQWEGTARLHEKSSFGPMARLDTGNIRIQQEVTHREGKGGRIQGHRKEGRKEGGQRRRPGGVLGSFGIYSRQRIELAKCLTGAELQPPHCSRVKMNYLTLNTVSTQILTECPRTDALEPLCDSDMPADVSQRQSPLTDIPGGSGTLHRAPEKTLETPGWTIWGLSGV